ncbi:MAG: hypothetical protein HFJ54_06215 [Clostridia bacterium]|nr:hypothetical protein [Clostridia bacterium]
MLFGIKANDNSYQCIMVQLSDDYVIPKEEEINAFYETEEYKSWDNEIYDTNNKEAEKAYFDRYSKISSDYYKSLGYTTNNCPDYTLTNEEKQRVIGKYILDGKELNSATNALFPGYKTFTAYDWGATKLYTIPKYYKDSESGEMTSNLSICLYFFEYYNRDNIRFNVDLWTH